MGCCQCSKCNIGCTERGIRILVGSVLVTLAYTHQAGAWAWIGLAPLASGLIRFCPAYALFKKSTCCNNTKNDGGCCNK